jgi:hypothetical protein
MGLSDEKSAEFFQKIANQMREVGLAWALEEILEEIDRGKEQFIASKKARKRQSRHRVSLVHSDSDVVKIVNREGIARSVDYSPQERLSILLISLERIIVSTSAMQDELVEKHKIIQFIPEQDQPERRVKFTTRPSSQVESVAKLHRLISDLQEQLK